MRGLVKLPAIVAAVCLSGWEAGRGDSLQGSGGPPATNLTIQGGDLWNPTAWDASGLRTAARLEKDLDAVKLYDAFVLAREAAWEKYADYQGEERTDSEYRRVFFTFTETGSPIFYSNGQEIVMELKPSINEK